jgi:hypothetical protein
MFDLATKTELKILEIKIERDLYKLEAKIETRLGAYTLAIIGSIIGAAVALHFGK